MFIFKLHPYINLFKAYFFIVVIENDMLAKILNNMGRD